MKVSKAFLAVAILVSLAAATAATMYVSQDACPVSCEACP
jgi:hypothetical protein